MGLITGLMSFLFGDGRNVVAETAQVFRANAENSAQRAADGDAATLAQFAAEFARPRQGAFDVAIDGLNRLPRPMLALGTIALFVSAMADPAWFSSRMQGLALVPEPLWWLMGAVVSFYFGARHQAKGQEFQRDLAQAAALGQALRPTPVATPLPAAPAAAPGDDDNAALADWRAQHG